MGTHGGMRCLRPSERRYTRCAAPGQIPRPSAIALPPPSYAINHLKSAKKNREADETQTEKQMKTRKAKKMQNTTKKTEKTQYRKAVKNIDKNTNTQQNTNELRRKREKTQKT